MKCVDSFELSLFFFFFFFFFFAYAPSPVGLTQLNYDLICFLTREFGFYSYMDRIMQKHVFRHMRIAKTHISLRIHAVLSGPSQCCFANRSNVNHKMLH